MPQIESLNATIRAEMARQRITQTELAIALSIPQTQVSARLRGAVEWRVTELLSVADLLGVPASTLLADIGTSDSPKAAS